MGPATLLDAAAEGDAAEDAPVSNFSGTSDNLSLEGQSDSDLVKKSHSGCVGN